MNERIREMAYKTAFEVPFEGPEHFVFYNSHLKKFVELIVKDCAELMPQEHLKQMVLKHFEVEQ